nr:hypothetical protein [Tanacetum cinerariifolium]
MAARTRTDSDHTRSISKSIFVTNFPDYTTDNDLWEMCNGYGTVVDVFIPNRKSNSGKRFAFVRPTANTAFRTFVNDASSFVSVLKGNPNTINHISTTPALVLDGECLVEQDLDNFVLGEVEDFSYINNLLILLLNEGFQHGADSMDRLEGVPLHAWSRLTFSKIGSRWGEMLELEDNKEDCFARKRICIRTKQ